MLRPARACRLHLPLGPPRGGQKCFQGTRRSAQGRRLRHAFRRLWVRERKTLRGRGAEPVAAHP